MRGTWIAISAAHARAHRLYGVRGWLIAVLWLNTLPVVQGGTVLAMQWMHGAVPRVAGVVSAVRLLQVVLPVGLLSAAFMRLRWFAPALSLYRITSVISRSVREGWPMPPSFHSSFSFQYTAHELVGLTLTFVKNLVIRTS